MLITDVDKIIGRNLRNLREIRKISATELYNKTGVKNWSGNTIKASISRYEKGTSPMTCGLAVLFANALDVPVNELFRGVAKYDPVTGDEPYNLEALFTPEELTLVEAFRSLSLTGKRQLKEYLKYLTADPKYNKELKKDDSESAEE